MSRQSRLAGDSWVQILWTMPDRELLILESLKQHKLANWVRPRIEALLDGREDRSKLLCCNGGCFVCVYELIEVLNEVEAAEKNAASPDASGPSSS